MVVVVVVVAVAVAVAVVVVVVVVVVVAVVAVGVTVGEGEGVGGGVRVRGALPSLNLDPLTIDNQSHHLCSFLFKSLYKAETYRDPTEMMALVVAGNNY